MKGKRLFFASIFMIGLILMGFNIIGLFLPFEHPDIYTEPNAMLDGASTLTQEQFDATITRRDSSDSSYVTTVNQAVHQRILHYWSEDEAVVNKYGYRVPLHENYILFLASYLNADVYRHYEYCDYRKAIERGVGMCSQQAMIATDILQEQGINAFLIGLAEMHAVATAQVDSENDTWWVIDPDYGVIVPHSIQEIYQNPQIIRSYYQQAGYTSEVVDHLVTWYSTDDINFRLICQESKHRFEQVSYIAVWLISVLLMLAGVLPYVRHLRSSHR